MGVRSKMRPGVSALLAVGMLLLGVLTIVVSAISTMKPQTGERESKVAKLRTILCDEQLRAAEPERMVKAIEEIGQMRGEAADAIPELLELLTFKRKFPQNTERSELHLVTPDGQYPAVGALFQIGEAAIPALIEVIESEEIGSLPSENAKYALQQIHRERPAEAVKKLEEAAARATSLDKSERLLKAAADTNKLVSSLKRVQ